MAPRKDLVHYWPDRVQEQMDRNRKLTERETQKLLHDAYHEQAKDLQDRVLATLAKIEHDLGTPEGVLVSDLYKSRRFYELLEYINKSLVSLGYKELKIVEEALLQTYTDALNTIDKNIPQELINYKFLVPDAIKPEQAIHQVWCLDGKEFSDRIWDNKAKLKTQLQKTLTDFVVQGKSNWSLAEALRENLQTNEYCAYRIVRTETCHLQNKAKTDKYQQLGFTHGRYLGTHCCDECKKLNGKVFTLEELSTLIPHHPHCTCTFTLERKPQEVI